MKRRILLLEKDKEASDRLEKAFSGAGEQSICQTDSMREACEALGQNKHDLIVIPLAHAQHQIGVFRAIQPGIAVAISAPPGEIPGDLQPFIQAAIDPAHSPAAITILNPPPDTTCSPTPAVASAQKPELRSAQESAAAAVDVAVPVGGASPPSTWKPAIEAAAGSSPWEPILGLLAFVIPRLLSALLVLVFIIFFTYLDLDMASGTDFRPAVQAAVPETVEYIGNLLHGDLGTTTTASGTARPIPMTEVLAIWLPRSLGLLAISLFFASAVGLILGIRAATRGSAQSLGISVATIIGVSVPSFFAAFLLQWAVTTATQFAGRTLLPVGGFGWDSHLILPVLVLAARPLAQITRITFVTVADVLQQDYVRTARSKGLRNFQVMGRHVMRNAAIPILTTIGVSLRFALVGLPIVEFYFGWLGAGYLLLNSIGQQDEELTIALVLWLGLVVIIINFLLEVSYRFIVPRLRTRPAHIGAGRSQSIGQRLKPAWSGLGDLLADNPVTDWIKERSSQPAESPFREALERGGIIIDADDDLGSGSGRTVRRFLSNAPLVFGGLLVLILLFVFAFGPNLAPNSPFTTLGLQMIDG